MGNYKAVASMLDEKDKRIAELEEALIQSEGDLERLEAENARLRDLIKCQKVAGSQIGSWTTLTDEQIDAAMEGM